MFDIKTSRDFLDKLEADYSDYMGQPESSCLALNCAMTAYHLHEWVWGDWLKKNLEIQTELGIHGANARERKNAYLEWLDRACIWFSTMQELTNGTKHFSTPSFQTMRVGAPPFMWDEEGAGWDRGNWDGPIPYAAEMHGAGCLMIDYGEGTGEHRYKTAAALLSAVVRFWREVFGRYHPDAEVRAGVRDWRMPPVGPVS